VAGHAAFPDLEDHQRVGGKLVARIEEHMAETTAGEDADHHRRDQGGFVGGVAGGRQALAAPSAEQPGRGEEAGRVRETVPMDAA